MPNEIERKYLVNKNLWEKIKPKERSVYYQGYLMISEELTVRIRTTNEKGFITIKSKSVGATRMEYEYEIPNLEAVEILENLISKKIKKYRYKILYDGKIWEVDEFLDENEGLIIAEVELSEESEIFKKPVWVGKEVTNEPRYFNAMLIGFPFTKW